MTFGICQFLRVRVMSTTMESGIRKDIKRRPQALDLTRTCVHGRSLRTPFPGGRSTSVISGESMDLDSWRLFSRPAPRRAARIDADRRFERP